MMMRQSAFDFPAPPAPPSAVARARAAGDEAGERAAKRAERQDAAFRDRAAVFVTDYLRAHSTASSEDITDAAKCAGIVPPDDRAFGPVYASLARRGRIAFAGYCVRRKGHGTAGGRLWSLVR